jgi:aryl-alcohol dehydrogenase-like predicted oxidoreductase
MDQQALDVQFEIMEQNDMSAIIGTPLASGKLTGAHRTRKGHVYHA